MIAAVNMTLLELLTFLLVILLFALAIYLFIKSRQTLRKALNETKNLFPLQSRKEKIREIFHPEEDVPYIKRTPTVHESIPVPVKKSHSYQDENITLDLKQTISQQQKLLNTYLKKVEELENEGREELRKENKELQREISMLNQQIKHRDAEMEELTQEAQSARKMAARVEEVYREFDVLQSKMQILEQQAGRANNLAMELEDARHSYEAVHNELLRKQEKLEEIMADNQRMRGEMDILEDKLAEANLQRQQLQKKVQFLSDLNSDLQSISDTNKKLQTELRRIGELESMLHMMAEERDFLLKRKKD